MFEPRWQCLSKHRGRSHAGRQAGGHGAVGGGVWKSLLKVSVQDGAAHPPPGAARPLWGSGEMDSP